MADYGLAGDFVFLEALNFLKKKRPLPREEYELLEESSRAKAFTVTGYSSAEVLNTFLNTLQDACEQGKTKKQFMDDMNTWLADQGYDGVNPWKSDTIFRTNVQTAYNAGHYKSMTDPEVINLRPYWMYLTAGDNHVRTAHAAMHNRVYRADDPIWDVWYPPNGFRCRCTVVSLTKSQVERRGLQVEDAPPYTANLQTGELTPDMPDKGFSNNPAKEVWKPDTSTLRPEVRQVYKEHTEAGR